MMSSSFAGISLFNRIGAVGVYLRGFSVFLRQFEFSYASIVRRSDSAHFGYCTSQLEPQPVISSAGGPSRLYRVHSSLKVLYLLRKTLSWSKRRRK